MSAELRPLHVLMVLESAFPSPRGGGAEAQVRTLAKAMRARGHHVTVVTPLTPAGPQRRIDRVDGCPVYRLPFPRLRRLGAAVLWLRLIGFLWSRRRRYDAWHVHIAHHLGAVCAVLGRWTDTPVVVKVSGWWELEQGTLATKPGSVSRAAFRALMQADAWQAISSRISAALVEKGIPASRIFAIPNAVDTARFSGITHGSSVAPRFVFVGRLVPEKGLDALLEAFANTSAACSNAHLRIVGTGPLEASLRQRATALGIASRVEFTGHRDDIEALLADADFGLLNSRIEGLSNTLLECMAAGLPMIASRVSGSEDVVRHGENGWLFPPADRDALIACLNEAAALGVDQRKAMGERARVAVERHAGLDRVVDALQVLYLRDGPATAASLPAAGRGG